MSASERLKALDGREMVRLDAAKYLAREKPDVVEDELYAALPQIVAVVEAAEACARADGRNDSGLTRLSCANARIALAALDEALS